MDGIGGAVWTTDEEIKGVLATGGGFGLGEDAWCALRSLGGGCGKTHACGESAWLCGRKEWKGCAR